jgi:mannose/cellobiose epimerase-like protein (N-acyl-D-glucosamine 2-epimerase family)
MSEYRRRPWLADRAATILSFYYPACVDTDHGGFVAQLDAETGEIYDPDAKHVVATARFTTNFWRGLQFCTADSATPGFGDGPLTATAVRGQIRRGVSNLRSAFRDDHHGGYHWRLDGRTPAASRRVCYGHAFVLLAYARAAGAGLDGAERGLADVAQVLDDRFYEPAAGLYASEFDETWTDGDDYRGQNANMHACEAMLASYEATGNRDHLERATHLAERLCVDLAEATDGRIWEHYTADWTHDFEYNRDTPADQFRPWGYQPGHHLEWAKLLALLDRHHDPAPKWLLTRARSAYDYAVTAGWDDDYGGFYYTLDRADHPIVDDKYGWPVAEAIGAAAALYERTGETSYLDDYDRFWDYAQRTLTAPAGNWYERASREGDPYATTEGPAVEPGYHPIGACFESWRSFARRPP